MKFIGLDGREYKTELMYKNFKSTANCSSYHKKARELLCSFFPASRFMEEFVLPGSRTSSSQNLRADFYIPSQNLIVEVHGEQHYEYTPAFHKNKFEFMQAKKRDKQKIDWCQVNNIDIVVLKYSEDEDEWRDAIRQRRNPEGYFSA